MDTIRRAFGGKSNDEKGKEKVEGKPGRTGKKAFDRVTQVSIPKYQMTKSGHVDYIVEVVKGGITWQVARRYTQFKKLHADLTSLCPMTTPYHCEHGVVPVLCGSSWTEVTNQSIGLIEKRKWYLEIYLEQLLVRRNRFYQSRTPLYAFLHDNEIPVVKPGSTPLPGLGAGGGRELKEEEEKEKAKPGSKPVSLHTSPKEKELKGATPPQTTAIDAKDFPKKSSAMLVPRVPQEEVPTYMSNTSEQPSCASDPGPSYLSLLNTVDMKESRSGSMSPSQSVKVSQHVCDECSALGPVFDLDKWEPANYCTMCQRITKWSIREEDEEESEGKSSEEHAEVDDAKDVATRPQWSDSTQCDTCGSRFSFFLRKHHCRKCGSAFCGYCSAFTHTLPELGYNAEVRVCKSCKQGLLQNTTSVPAPSPASSTTSLLHPTSEFLTNSQQLSAADFELVTTVGKGTFGKVMKVRHCETGELYAMKVLSKKIVHKRRMVEYIREEKDILASVNHPFIVHLYAAFQTDHNLYLLLEFLPGGELYSHIYNQGRFGEVDARFYTAEMVLAVGYLHSKDIVHRDIKPENIVLDREGHAVLTDFGLAKKDFSKASRRSFVGSSEYLSPETIRGDGQTKAVDWWSLGVLLYEMLIGAAPFNGTNNNDVYQQILHKDLDFSKLNPQAKSILKRLLCREVRHRLKDAEEVKQCEFFDCINWELLEQKKLTPPFVPDLAMNDTRYFSREFTHEWANLDVERAGKSTLDLLCQKFDNFPLEQSKGEADLNAAVSKNAYVWDGEQDDACDIDYAKAITMTESADCGTPVDTILGNPPQPSDLNAQHIVGVWRLCSLEMVTEGGKVSYPWGSDVVGQATYTSNGMFSLECTQTRGNRARFRDAEYTRVTRDEMAEAYLTYASSFGHYTYLDGDKYFTHHCVGSLCPNWAEAEQKRYFRFVDGAGNSDVNYLILATGQIIIDGMAARTVMKFQRLSENPDLPDFMKRRRKRAEEAAAKEREEKEGKEDKEDKEGAGDLEKFGDKPAGTPPTEVPMPIVEET